MHGVSHTRNDEQLSFWEHSSHLFSDLNKLGVKLSDDNKCPSLDARQDIPKRRQHPSPQAPKCRSQTSLGIAESLSVALCTYVTRELKLTLKKWKAFPSSDKILDTMQFYLARQCLIIRLPL
jgi:hypothetical protein